VANTFSDASPATAHLRLLADVVKQGVWSAGGVPFEFGVPGLCGNIAVGHENCRYKNRHTREGGYPVVRTTFYEIIKI